MKAMLLAAGFGKRLRPLTDKTPKPLVPVGGKRLIDYHLEKLSAAGFDEVIINVSYLADQIQQALGDGSQWNLKIRYSVEKEPLETGGAIQHALPLLGNDPFLLINADVWTDFPFTHILKKTLGIYLGHLYFVNNPKHNQQGDYTLNNGAVDVKDLVSPHIAVTFSGISLLNPELIRKFNADQTCFPLRDVFSFAVEEHMLSGELYSGQWWDIGTTERLQALNQQLKS